MAPAVTPTTVSPAIPPSDYELTHVHAVYDHIASHFSATRYKPWPIIATFIASLSPSWIGLDSGTGNGKYLHLAPWMVGLDRSRNLLDIARGTEMVREVIQGDVLGACWRNGIFDYAISIATIHHLATPERRKLAVKRLISAVSASHGRVLIYVWAIEQDAQSKRNIPTTNAEGGQDVFVPWVLSDDKSKVFNRYYHMFAEGELDALVADAVAEMGLVLGAPQERAAGVEVVQHGWERSNHYVELRRWQSTVF